jgi:hypothetical protein
MHRQLSVVAASAIALASIGLLLHIPAAATAIDPATAARGSLGVSLQDLAIDSTVGQLSFYLNGGLALLFGAFAVIVVRANARQRYAARRKAAVPVGHVRATMAEVWVRLSRRMWLGHGSASRH